MNRLQRLAAIEVRQMAREWRYFASLLGRGELPPYGFYPLCLVESDPSLVFFDLEDSNASRNEWIGDGQIVVSIRHSLAIESEIIFEMYIGVYLAMRLECGENQENAHVKLPI
jgi:hypothetical protein